MTFNVLMLRQWPQQLEVLRSMPMVDEVTMNTLASGAGPWSQQLRLLSSALLRPGAVLQGDLKFPFGASTFSLGMFRACFSQNQHLFLDQTSRGGTRVGQKCPACGKCRLGRGQPAKAGMLKHLHGAS